MSKPTYDRDRFLEGLKSTVTQVLSTMAWADVNFEGILESDTFALDDEMGGLVRLEGAHNGIVGISSKKRVAEEVVSRITGLSPADLTREDLLDGISELANMVCGGMKTKAEAPDLDLSSPLAILGTDYMALWKTDQPTQILSFRIGDDLFRVHFCM